MSSGYQFQFSSKCLHERHVAGRMSFRPGLPYMRQRWDALKCTERCNRMNSIVMRSLLLGLILLSGLPMRDGGAVFGLSKKGGGVRGVETCASHDFRQKGADNPALRFE